MAFNYSLDRNNVNREGATQLPVDQAYVCKIIGAKEAGAVVDRLDHYADMKTEISLDDWKKEWKIKYLVFTSKERSKIFKTKGTMDGFVEFLKKYVDKSATINDITVEGGWWIYLDDPHELKVSLNDNNGALNIYRQR